MDSEEFEGLHSLHTFTVDVQGGRGGSVPSEVQDEFLGLGDDQCQVVRNTTLTKFQDLISVGLLVSPCYKAHHRCVISEFDKDVLWGSGTAVVCVEGVE